MWLAANLTQRALFKATHKVHTMTPERYRTYERTMRRKAHNISQIDSGDSHNSKNID